MPVVSVIIPAYNAQATLGAALESVLSQTVPDFEAIVVDDGSTDATSSVAAAAADPRVKLIATRNEGVARARNRGLEIANGKFVAFLDADDLWRQDKLERQLTALSSAPGAVVCHTAAIRIDEHGKANGHLPVAHYADPCAGLLLHANFVVLSSALVTRELVIGAGGFDPDLSQCADWDLWLRLSLSAAFFGIEAPLVLYRTASANMSSDVALLERDTFAVLDKFFATPVASPYEPIRAQTYSNHWMICSGSYLHQGRLGDSLRCLVRGVRTRPANIGRALRLPIRWSRRLLGRFRWGASHIAP